MTARWLTLLLCCTGLASAEEIPNPSVIRTGETSFRLNDITFDSASREIRFPAEVNMTDGLLEFAIVHRKGKVHESLLSTAISPADLNVVFALLKYAPSPEWQLVPGKDGAPPEFADVPEAVRKAARIDIGVEWREGDRTRRATVNELIQHTARARAMPPGPWVYGGSEIHEGRFAPEVTGDLVAIFITNSALIQYPGDDNQDDTVWIPYPKRVPAVGTPVQVVIAPHVSLSPP